MRGGRRRLHEEARALHPRQSFSPFPLRFQELDLSPEALLNIKESQREAEWTDAVKRAIMELGQYNLVQSVRLVGMMMLVFVQKPLLPHISEVEADTLGTGLWGVAVSVMVMTVFMCTSISVRTVGSDLSGNLIYLTED